MILPHSSAFKTLDETFANYIFYYDIHSWMDRMAVRNCLAGLWAGWQALVLINIHDACLR